MSDNRIDYLAELLVGVVDTAVTCFDDQLRTLISEQSFLTKIVKVWEETHWVCPLRLVSTGVAVARKEIGIFNIGFRVRVTNDDTANTQACEDTGHFANGRVVIRWYRCAVGIKH